MRVLVEDMMFGRTMLRLEWFGLEEEKFIFLTYQGLDTEEFYERYFNPEVNYLRTELLENDFQFPVGDVSYARIHEVELSGEDDGLRRVGIQHFSDDCPTYVD